MLTAKQSKNIVIGYPYYIHLLPGYEKMWNSDVRWWLWRFVVFHSFYSWQVHNRKSHCCHNNQQQQFWIHIKYNNCESKDPFSNLYIQFTGEFAFWFFVLQVLLSSTSSSNLCFMSFPARFQENQSTNHVLSKVLSAVYFCYSSYWRRNSSNHQWEKRE